MKVPFSSSWATLDNNVNFIERASSTPVYPFFDRGIVLCIAEVTQRMRAGVVHCYYGSGKYDPIEPGNPESPDRAGCVSILTPDRVLSKNGPGMAPNSCLVEISVWEG